MLKRQAADKIKLKKFKENVLTLFNFFFYYHFILTLEFGINFLFQIEKQINDFIQDDALQNLTMEPMDKVSRSVVYVFKECSNIFEILKDITFLVSDMRLLKLLASQHFPLEKKILIGT